MPRAHHFAILTTLLLLATPVSQAASPSPSTNWFSLINSTHTDPTNMVVIIVPAAYYSQSAMVGNQTWIGPNALYMEPGVQAALEAVNYWAWMIDQYETTYPQLQYVSYTTKVLGYDATPLDLANAKIVVNTAMLADPAPFVFHAGLGAPTWPLDWWFDSSQGHDVCTVWNTGFGQSGSASSSARLRNLVIHEFGHCLGVGHTGTSLGLQHCNAAGTCYTNHPTDVMSVVSGSARQCISNLNMMSLAEGYAWATGPTATWQPHDGEVYLAKTAYNTTCMPTWMNKF